TSYPSDSSKIRALARKLGWSSTIRTLTGVIVAVGIPPVYTATHTLWVPLSGENVATPRGGSDTFRASCPADSSWRRKGSADRKRGSDPRRGSGPVLDVTRRAGSSRPNQARAAAA